jgi:hypothetical protein
VAFLGIINYPKLAPQTTIATQEIIPYQPIKVELTEPIIYKSSRDGGKVLK